MLEQEICVCVCVRACVRARACACVCRPPDGVEAITEVGNARARNACVYVCACVRTCLRVCRPPDRVEPIIEVGNARDLLWVHREHQRLWCKAFCRQKNAHTTPVPLPHPCYRAHTLGTGRSRAMCMTSSSCFRALISRTSCSKRISK